VRPSVRGKGNVSDREGVGEVSGVCEVRTIRKYRKVERRNMSEYKLTERGKAWIGELTQQLSDGTEKLIILDAQQCKGLHTVLTETWNTRQPRFSKAEREALSELIGAGIYQSNSLIRNAGEYEKFKMESLHASIATVRAMLKGELC